MYDSTPKAFNPWDYLIVFTALDVGIVGFMPVATNLPLPLPVSSLPFWCKNLDPYFLRMSMGGCFLPVLPLASFATIASFKCLHFLLLDYPSLGGIFYSITFSRLELFLWRRRLRIMSESLFFTFSLQIGAWMCSMLKHIAWFLRSKLTVSARPGR